MKIELDSKEKKIVVLTWLKQGFINTDDIEGLNQVFTVQVCRSREDVANKDNDDYWKYDE